ncbi:alpha/beta fold hydrolase [Microbacterium sp. ZW T5_45]|uniref:alpha/beta fold hydrolase n=1 Tax=Microbacterium sp. ZW T5_45 TaxID=3378080 RepID=UPI0038529920
MTDRRFRSDSGALEIHETYETLLQRYLPSAVRHTIATSIGDIATITSGSPDAPPVVLLHGSGSTALSWAPTIQRLTATHRVHAIDLPGEPGQSTPTRIPFVVHDQASWLSEVHRELVGGPAAYVGVSLGGWIATAFAASYPDQVTHLILHSSSGFGPRKIAPLVVAGLLTALGEPGRRRALSYLTGPRKNQEPRTELQAQLDLYALRTFAHFSPRTDALPEHSTEVLQGIRGQLTATFGAKDRMLDAVAAAHRIRAEIPSASVELRPDEGHILSDQPALTYNQLASR